MNALVVCPECKRKLKVPESAAGKTIRCPGCKAVLPTLKRTSTEETEEAASKPVERETMKTVPSRPSTAAFPRKAARKPEEFEDDQPRRKRKRTRRGISNGLIAGLIGGGGLLILALVVGGITMHVYSARDKTIPDAEWQSFTPPNSDCTILMPGTPVPQTLSMHGINLTQYKVERKGGKEVFGIGFFDLPPHLLRPNLLQDMVNNWRDAVVAQTKFAVTSNTTIALGNMEGREFQMKPPALERGTLIGRSYLGKIGNQHRVYIVMAGGDNIYPNKGDAVRFFDSFRVTATVSPPSLNGAPGAQGPQPPNFNPMQPNQPQPNQWP